MFTSNRVTFCIVLFLVAASFILGSCAQKRPLVINLSPYGGDDSAAPAYKWSLDGSEYRETNSIELELDALDGGYHSLEIVPMNPESD